VTQSADDFGVRCGEGDGAPDVEHIELIMRLLSTVAILLLSCASSDGPRKPQRCEQLRDYLVDLQVQDINVVTGVDRQSHRRAMSAALGDAVATCVTKLSDSQVGCALDATSSTMAAACARDRP
jgi:hypothetical protein